MFLQLPLNQVFAPLNTEQVLSTSNDTPPEVSNNVNLTLQVDFFRKTW